jgi:pimeloyl-ACP methyl ester carboxylesterase
MRAAFASLFLLLLASCSQTDRGNSNAGRIRVDVGGHKLEVIVEGTDLGHPTVILESGLGGGIDSWTPVRESLAKVTRVVSYNRAGSGGSQPGPRPRSALQIVKELREMLQRLEIAPPYILVGHSIGGLYARAYAGLHPEEVFGLVLVDPTMELGESLSTAQVHARLQQLWGSDYARIQKILDRVHPKMAAIAAQSILGLEPYLERMPIAEQRANRAAWLDLFADHSQHIEGMLGLLSDAERQEMFAVMESMRLVRQSPAVSTRVALLVAGKVASKSQDGDTTTDPNKSIDYLAWAQTVHFERNSEYIETIPGGTMKTLPDAGHNIPADRPDAIIEAVTQLLDASAAPSPNS